MECCQVAVQQDFLATRGRIDRSIHSAGFRDIFTLPISLPPYAPPSRRQRDSDMSAKAVPYCWW